MMVAFHVFCGELLNAVRINAADYRPTRLMLLTAIPALLIPVVLWLVLAKPPL
jgi:uncharacterized membrane protein